MAAPKKPAVDHQDTTPDVDRASTATLEDATRAGLLGVEVDGTPNRAYTVEGVTRQ